MSAGDDTPDQQPAPALPPARRPRPSLRRSTEVFRNRHFRFLFASSTFGFGGMQIEQVARALLAWHLTESFAWTGAIMLSFGLPMAAFSLIGGAMADRVEKRNLLMMTQAVTTVVTLITATLILTDAITIEILFGLGLIQGTFFALGMPSRTPLMAEVVGQEQVASAIAVSNAAMNGTRLFGPALAGAIVAFAGLEAAFYTQAAFFGISTLLILRVPTGIARNGPDGRPRPRATAGVFSEVGAGLSYVAHDRTLRLLIAMMFITTLFAMPYMLLLAGFVQRDLGQSEAVYGYLQSLGGAGALAGSLMIAAMADFDRKPLIQWIAGVLSGLGLILLALGSMQIGVAAAAVMVTVLGFTLTAYQTINMTIIMETAEPRYYGRVMSLNMLTFSAMPIMSAPLGIAADRIGAAELFIVMGAIVGGFMILIALTNPGHAFGRHQTRADRERAAEVAAAANIEANAAVEASSEAISAPRAPDVSTHGHVPVAQSGAPPFSAEPDASASRPA